MLITDVYAIEKRKSLMTMVVVIACLFALTVFPIQNAFQVLVMSAMFLVAMPMLYTMLILRQPQTDFGLTVGNARAGWLWVVVSIPAIMVIVLLLMKLTTIFDDYVLPQLVRNNFSVFLMYELLVVGTQVIIWEYFLRGFVIGGLRNVIGWGAVLVSVVISVIIILDNLLMLGFAIAAPFAAIAAYYSRSVYYSIIITITTVLFIDVLMITAIR